MEITELNKVVDDWALNAFRQYTDERLAHLRQMFANLRHEQMRNGDEVGAVGSQAMLNLVLKVQKERR